jgi:hypothetical protein
MKRYYLSLFILFLVGTLSSQNLNFRDTNKLKVLLCSKSWIRYHINEDSTFSDKVLDSFKFYPNNTYFKSARPKDDTSDKYLSTFPINGIWFFGSTAKVSRADTMTNCIQIITQIFNPRSNGTIIRDFILIDGNMLKDSKNKKRTISLDEPFIAECFRLTGIKWDRRLIWQPLRIYKKPRSNKH